MGSNKAKAEKEKVNTNKWQTKVQDNAPELFKVMSRVRYLNQTMDIHIDLPDHHWTKLPR